MTPPVNSLTVALLLSTIAPLSAQNLESNTQPPVSSLKSAAPQHPDAARFRHGTPLPGTYEVPDLKHVECTIKEQANAIRTQNPVSLAELDHQKLDVESVVDLDVLRQPSPYRNKVILNVKRPYQIETDGLNQALREISAIYRQAGSPPTETGCNTIGISVSQRIRMEPSTALEIVEFEISANPGCACEIVKAAITATATTPQEAAAIVETAILAAPDSIRIVSQCAIATMPESLAAVQTLLTAMAPHSAALGNPAETATASNSNTATNTATATNSDSARQSPPANARQPLPNPLDPPSAEAPHPPRSFTPPVASSTITG